MVLDAKIEKFIIREDMSIKEAIKLISKSGRGIAISLDKNDKLLGIITDSDIRNGILNGVSMDVSYKEILNIQPVTVSVGMDKAEIKKKLIKLGRRYMPVVDNGKLVDLIFSTDFGENFIEIKNNKVVIMAGGEGTRLDPLTKIIPKPLIPLGDAPIIEVLMKKFAKFGFNSFIVSLNYKAEMIKMYFKHNNQYDIAYANEAELPNKEKLGTIGALGLVKNQLERSFVVVNCDTIIKTDYDELLKHHNKSGNVLTLVSSMKHITIPFGILDIENGGALREIKEKPEYDYLVNTGMYVMEPKVLDYIVPGEKIDIPKLLDRLKDNNEKIGIYPISQDDWFDTGQWEAYQHTLKNYEKFV